MLPVELPKINQLGEIGNPLDKLTDWKIVKIDGKKFTKITQLLLLIASLNLIRRGFGF